MDKCVGLDVLVTNRLWRQLGFVSERALHGIRWGRHIKSDGVNDFVWILEISGAVPPAHLVDGYKGAVSERQPSMYFPLGGGTIKGVSKPGWVIWSRVFVEKGNLNCDLGLGEAVHLPDALTQEHWKFTTPQWPLMNMVMRGITRDQFMARHKANHIQVAYAPDEAGAKKALFAKAAALNELGLDVFICGKV